MWPWLATFCILLTSSASQGLIKKMLQIKTCGQPTILNSMMNVTVRPGEMAQFKCQVDMSCIVSYIEWFHDMPNGSQKLIKTASSNGDPHIHTIRNVEPLHRGLYTCQAGNVLGKAEASAYLEVSSGTRCQTSLTGCLLFMLFSRSLLCLLCPTLFTTSLLSD